MPNKKYQIYAKKDKFISEFETKPDQISCLFAYESIKGLGMFNIITVFDEVSCNSLIGTIAMTKKGIEERLEAQKQENDPRNRYKL